ncbi:MAG: winged helix-turn-helix transcriptional regulator [Planctomycetes bacterium]|nr:winged helix-turn-helix transcriptional regulator [Planctomycetota bacterium]
MRKERVSDCARLLRTLAHPTRLLILDELARGMKCVNDIREILDVPQPNVSQHLAVLKRAGLVRCHKEGVSRCYQLAKPGFVRSLFAALERGVPAVNVGDPPRCRAPRRRAGTPGDRR